MTRCARTGREQPQQNLRLLDHLVSAGKQPRRQLQSERLRGDPVHDEIELGRLFYGSDVAACSRASQYRNSRTKGVRLITMEWGMPVEKIDTLVVGGGQAGIAMSEHLSVNGVPHLLLERNRVAERWRSARNSLFDKCTRPRLPERANCRRSRLDNFPPRATLRDEPRAARPRGCFPRAAVSNVNEPINAKRIKRLKRTRATVGELF